MRHRTTQRLAFAFSIIFVACLAGAAWVIVRAPDAVLVVVAAAVVVGVLLHDTLDGPVVAAIVGAVVGVVGLAAYALYLAGIPECVAVGAAIGVVVLVLVIVVRALIASGSADYPYDD